MTDELKNKVDNLFNIYDHGISNIVEFNNLIPGLQQTRETLQWVRDSLNNSPTQVSLLPNEHLSDILEKATQGAAVLRSFPKPPSELGPVLNTSGSAVYTIYFDHIRKVESYYIGDPIVVDWARTTKITGEKLVEKQNRSGIVSYRLSLIHPMLEMLHKEAIDLCVRAKAEADGRPVGASMTLTRLLDQFKGNLIDKCKGGDGANYNRISERLAANSALTKTTVLEGQSKYENLKSELLEIRKKGKPSSGDRIEQILREVEGHILTITDALDPDKLGITF